MNDAKIRMVKIEKNLSDETVEEVKKKDKEGRKSQEGENEKKLL